MTTETKARIGLSARGLELDGEPLPLHSGSVHYFRLPRSGWQKALVELRKLGARLVDVYVPWSVHETARGRYDFGSGDPRLDVTAFLGTAAELGLKAIVRPGPHVNAELTGFGIPERVLWDPACQARSPAGTQVVLPVPPLAFPVPSYASNAFHEEVAGWLRAVAERLAPLAWPEGPIVLVQVDNEGALYFRDGPYDQDHHPDARAQYRRFLRKKYGGPAAIRASYGDPALDLSTIEPPARLDVASADGLARHLDWAEFQEAMLESALYRFRAVLDQNGFSGIPMMHNLPIGERSTPLDPARLGRAVDFVALDYYHGAFEGSRREIARRTSHLAVRGAATNRPAFAAEMGAGFAPNLPPLTEAENAFSVLSALAYGLRGLNVYMAVQRDRWIGAPIDARGRPRASAEFWTRLFSALERLRFYELVRDVPVHVLVPRSFDRLLRVCHAFGPIPPVALALAGGADLGLLEGDLDPTSGAAAETERFLGNLWQALDVAQVAHAFVGADLAAHSFSQAKWTVVACPGALDADLTARAAEHVLLGRAVSFGPRTPERDASFRPIATRLPRVERPRAPLLLPADLEALGPLVERAAEELGIPRLAAEPAGIRTAVHRDRTGVPRVLFVLNPTETAVEAVVEAPGARRARDSLSREEILVTGEHAVLPVEGRTVRMLELESGG